MRTGDGARQRICRVGLQIAANSQKPLHHHLHLLLRRPARAHDRVLDFARGVLGHLKSVDRRAGKRRAARLQPCATLPERAAAPQPMGTTRVGEALLELEEKLRMPLVLHYMEGYSVADVAAVLRIPQGTVKTRLRRGREALKALLTPPIGGVSRDPG